MYIVCTVGVGIVSAKDLRTGDGATGDSLGDDCTAQHCNLLSVNSAIGVASVKSIRRSPGSKAKVLPASVELLPPGETCVCPSDVCGVQVFCDPGDAEDTEVDAAAAAASAGGRSSSSKLYCLVNFLTRETLISCFSVGPVDGVVSGRTGAGLIRVLQAGGLTGIYKRGLFFHSLWCLQQCAPGFGSKHPHARCSLILQLGAYSKSSFYLSFKDVALHMIRYRGR